MVKAYEIYLSNDGKTWGTAVATGEFKNTTSLQVAKLKTATTARYLKFVAKSEINGKAWTSAAEISVQAEDDPSAILLPNDAGAGTKPAHQHVYDLQGRQVTSSTHKKGVYIQQGRKYLNN